MNDAAFETTRGQVPAFLTSPIAWLVFAPSGIAWCLMILLARIDPGLSLCLAPRPNVSAQAIDASVLALANVSLAALAQAALLMALAMALPLAWKPALHVMSRSFRRDSASHVALLVFTLSAIWALLLVALSIMGIMLQAGLAALLPAPLVGCVACLAAAIHRNSAHAEIALRQCHRVHPMRAFAPGSYYDVIGYAAAAARACARVCWPAMLLSWFTRWPLLTMAAVTALAFRDRMLFRPTPRIPVTVFSLLAILELVSVR
jgi:hypothetical protein